MSEELIVSSDMAIAELIPRMKTLSCRLILRGDRIDGLVTQSDLPKLPVRVVVFGLLTHLEMVMADLVSTHWPGGEWMTALSPGRRAKLLEKETVLRQRGLNPPRIELTEFADKRDLCKRLLAAGRTRFDRRWTGAQLRDQLAHAATFFDDADVRRGLDRLSTPGCRAVLGAGVDGADTEGIDTHGPPPPRLALVLMRVGTHRDDDK